MDEKTVRELDEYLGEINNVRPLKPVPSKILSLLKTQDIDIKKLAELIKKDPSLTANILKYANSSFFGFRKKLTSIQQIISLIGIKEIKKLTLIYAVKSKISKDLTVYGISSSQLWKHSISTATGAQFLARLKGIFPSDNAFTAGLLVDLGKIVLNVFIIKYGLNLFENIKDKNSFSLHKIERQLLGKTHSEIAAILLDRWNFAEDIVISINFHHYPSRAPKYRELTSVIHLSDLVSTACLYDWNVNDYEKTIDDFALKTLDIKFNDLKELIDLMREEIENAEREYI